MTFQKSLLTNTTAASAGEMLLAGRVRRQGEDLFVHLAGRSGTITFLVVPSSTYNLYQAEVRYRRALQLTSGVSSHGCFNRHPKSGNIPEGTQSDFFGAILKFDTCTPSTGDDRISTEYWVPYHSCHFGCLVDLGRVHSGLLHIEAAKQVSKWSNDSISSSRNVCPKHK